MYYEMRTYTVQIGKMNEYLRHFEKEGLPVISAMRRWSAGGTRKSAN